MFLSGSLKSINSPNFQIRVGEGSQLENSWVVAVTGVVFVLRMILGDISSRGSRSCYL
jgi:hypothetical protein